MKHLKLLLLFTLLSAFAFGQTTPTLPSGSIQVQTYKNSNGKNYVGNAAKQFEVIALQRSLDSAINTNKPYKAIVYEGDSFTDISCGGAYCATNYPSQIGNYNTNVARAQQINVASSGQRLSTFISSGQYASQIQPNKPPSNKERVILSLMIGINDFFDGRTASQVYNDLKTVWAQAKADGFTVVAFTLTRSTNGTVDPLAAATSALIASDPSLYDYLVRTDLILPNPADLAYYESDGLHLNANGSKKLAQELARVLTSQINGYSTTTNALQVLKGNTQLKKVTVDSLVNPNFAATSALLAGGGQLQFPIGAGGTGVATVIPIWTASNLIANSRMAESSTHLFVDSRVRIGNGTSYGVLDVKTGTVLTYNLSGQSDGSFSFGNASGSASIPTMIGKSADNRGLFFIAATADANSPADMEFNIREGDDTDYTTTTGGGIKFSRYNTQLAYLSRTGNMSILGSVTPAQYKLSALNTAPSSSTDTGELGEIRITAGYIYVCIATNTWVRTALTTW